MAIGLVGSPAVFTPGRNPIYWYFSSTTSSNEGFKYLVDVYSAGTGNILAQYSVWKRPVDGFCELNLNTLKDYLTYDLNQNLSGFSLVPNSHVNYNLEVGEEYVFNWLYNNYHLASAAFPATAYPLNVILSSTTAHQFQVGDLIEVVQNSATGQTNITGTQQIIEVPSASAVTIGLTYSTFSTGIGGTATYDDHHKTQYTGLSSYSGYIASNSAVYHKDFYSYNSNDFLINASTAGRFLTNVPSGYKIMPENNIYLNYWAQTLSFARLLKIVTDDGSTYLVSNSLSADTHEVKQVNAGANNVPSDTLALSGATFPIIKSSTVYYDAYLIDSSAAQNRKSEILRFYIDDVCSMYNNVEIYFVDRMGSIIPVNFQLNSKRSYSYERTDYKRKLGDLDQAQAKYTFNSTDAGRTIQSVNEMQSMTAYKDQLTENDRVFLKDLLATRQAWIKEDGLMWPIIITDNNYEELTQLNENYVPFVINFSYANNNIC